jgi:hypothetical protein
MKSVKTEIWSQIENKVCGLCGDVRFDKRIVSLGINSPTLSLAVWHQVFVDVR